MFVRKCEKRKNEDRKFLFNWQIVIRCQSWEIDSMFLLWSRLRVKKLSCSIQISYNWKILGQTKAFQFRTLFIFWYTFLIYILSFCLYYWSVTCLVKQHLNKNQHKNSFSKLKFYFRLFLFYFIWWGEVSFHFLINGCLIFLTFWRCWRIIFFIKEIRKLFTVHFLFKIIWVELQSWKCDKKDCQYKVHFEYTHTDWYKKEHLKMDM